MNFPKGTVEVLALTDLRSMSLGDKRNRLMAISTGDFMIHLDDDDRLVSGALDKIVPVVRGAIEDDRIDVDVVAYNSMVFLNGSSEPLIVDTSLEHENEQVRARCPGDVGPVRIKRKPWHWCCWRSSLARNFRFTGYVDEDWSWLRQVIPCVSGQVKLDHTLHVYNHDDTESLCMDGGKILT